MTIAVTVLGSSGSYAGAGNPCSGFVVDNGSTRVWLDCGTGTLGPLQEHVDLSELDAVVVTHCHPDHCLELPVLRNALKYLVGRSGLPVYGPGTTRERIESALGDKVAPTFDWHPVSDGTTFTVGGLTFGCSRTDHPVETVAVRIEDDAGRVVAYSADTGPAWSLERFGGPIHLALCEASLAAGDEHSFQHLSGRQAGRLARDAGAERLVLTHLPPGTDVEDRRLEAEADDAFAGPVAVALPGRRFTA
jgi:ribonuclease BN (tRNA processing enzyme)